jgi:hypothetical protein
MSAHCRAVLVGCGGSPEGEPLLRSVFDRQRLPDAGQSRVKAQISVDGGAINPGAGPNNSPSRSSVHRNSAQMLALVATSPYSNLRQTLHTHERAPRGPGAASTNRQYACGNRLLRLVRYRSAKRHSMAWADTRRNMRSRRGLSSESPLFAQIGRPHLGIIQQHFGVATHRDLA